MTQDGLVLEFSEMEAAEVKSLLAANGIEAFVRGASQLPNLPYEILVPSDQREQAEAVFRDASQAGPAAAEEAERAGEAMGDTPPEA
jgi:hypothetical protein